MVDTTFASLDYTTSIIEGDIPSGKEMFDLYGRNDPPVDKGLVCYNRFTDEPAGIAFTMQGTKYFTTHLQGNFTQYYGDLDENYLPHGLGFIRTKEIFFTANFTNGYITDPEVTFYSNNGKIKKACFVCATRLY